MRAPTNGAENRNLTDYMESMGGAHILMIGGADTEILHPSLFNIQYSLFRFVVTEGSDKSEFNVGTTGEFYRLRMMMLTTASTMPRSLGRLGFSLKIR